MLMINRSETWKPVVGYEGLYEVSDQGRVRSLDRVVDRGRLGKSLRPGKILKGSIDSKRYLYVSLYKDGRRNHRIHQLVSRAFIGIPQEGQEVRHRDGSRDNNVVENLEWGSRSENILDAVGHGTHSSASKTHCKSGHELGGLNSDGKDRECWACRRASATVKYHKDLKPRFQEVADIHYRNLLGERRRMLRSDFPM